MTTVTRQERQIVFLGALCVWTLLGAAVWVLDAKTPPTVLPTPPGLGEAQYRPLRPVPPPQHGANTITLRDGDVVLSRDPATTWSRPNDDVLYLESTSNVVTFGSSSERSKRDADDARRRQTNPSVPWITPFPFPPG